MVFQEKTAIGCGGHLFEGATMFSQMRCVKCGQVKPRKAFSKKDPKGLYSWNPRCIECRRAYHRQYQDQNRDKWGSAYQRQWRAEHPEQSRKYGRKWRKKNPEYHKGVGQRRRLDPEYVRRQKERGRQYYQTQKAKRQTEEYRERRRKQRRKYRAKETEYARLRRARIYGAARNFSQDDWLRILDKQDHKCKYCGEPFSDDLPPTVDHVLPLSKGGHHTAINIVAACKPCNSQKQARVPEQLELFPLNT